MESLCSLVQAHHGARLGLHAGMRPRLHADMSASGNSVEPVLLEQQIDRLLPQRLRRGLQIEREQPKLLPCLGREVDRQGALALAAAIPTRSKAASKPKGEPSRKIPASVSPE